MELLWYIVITMFERSLRKRAAKAIAKVEKNGGYVMDCGCFVAAKSASLRRMLEDCGPEAVLEVESDVRAAHDEHAAGPPGLTLP